MNDLRLYNDTVCSETLVSNLFIDQFMPSANGEYVKIYLHLLRCTQHGSACSVSSIADLFDLTEKDVIRGLRYWERQGLLTIEQDAEGQLTGLHLTAPTVPAVSAAAAIPGTASVASAVSGTASVSAASAASHFDEIPQYSADEILAFSNNPEIPEMLFIIETYLKHPLSDTDTNTILFWYAELHFNRDLIEYLVEYCVTKDHSSLRYMNKVAMNWAEEGITNETQARQHSALQSQLYYAVMKSLGIHGRNLSPVENEFVQRWNREYGFGTELITAACERTILSTHQPSFEYTESILANWKKQGVRNMADVQAADALFEQKRKASARPQPQAQPKRNNFTNFDQRSYNEDDLERMLLNTDI